ncbi:hypothetical protein UVI_02034890 [Ustilaginoidea virens]|nr:hypothetical protein UVI_02034890 [Ustilaginoidea virens]
MQARFAPPVTQAQLPPPAPTTNFEPPQYAEFDASKKGAEDSLPHMPSWEQAESKRVAVEEAVEMSNLEKSATFRGDRQRTQHHPSPEPVSPLSQKSMTYGNQPYGGGLAAGSSGYFSNHSQQGLVPDAQAPGYGVSSHSQQGLVPGAQVPGYAVASHGQQGLVPGAHVAGYGQSGRGNSPANEYDRVYNNRLNNTSHESVGFGLDEPYDDHVSISSANTQNFAGHTTQAYGAPLHQPHETVSSQPYGATGGAVLRQQTISPLDPMYGLPPASSAAMGPGGRQSPAPTQAQGKQTCGQDQIHERFIEMPAMPQGQSNGDGCLQTQRAQISPVSPAAPVELVGSAFPQAYGLGRSPAGQVGSPVHGELAGSTAPQAYGLRSPPAGDNASPAHSELAGSTPSEAFVRNGIPVHGELAGSTPTQAYGLSRTPTGEVAPPALGRPPHGMNSRTRNPTGPGPSPGPRGGGPHGRDRPPRGSPAARNDEGYGRPSQPPRNLVVSTRSYSPAPPRQLAPGSEPRFSPGPERQLSAASDGHRAPQPHPASKAASRTGKPFCQSPPQSPITNNAGFDFISGYARPQDSQPPPRQSPTSAAYPGQRVYQPGHL